MSIRPVVDVEQFIELTGYAPDILALALLGQHDDASSGREKCENCDEFTVDGLTVVDGSDWCETCRDNDAYFCEHCEEHSQESTSTVLTSSWSDVSEEWCENCANYDAETCEDCNVVVADSTNRIRHTDWGNSYCESCWDDRFTYCDDCDEYHDVNDEPCRRAAIHPYGSIFPQGWIPVGTGPKFFGVEIEVENANSRYDVVTNAADTYDLLETLDGGIWITHDGSLNNGYEITSQPLSLETWHNNRSNLIAAFTELTNRGVRAWDRNTDSHPVGIHVHIDRRAFDNQYHLLRFLHLFRSLRHEWARAAGRDCHYADFDALRKLKDKATGRRGSNHSDAVSVRDDTVEVRIFRSTLATDRLLGDIELVAAACEFTRKARLKSHADRLALRHDWVRFLALNYPLAGRVWQGERFTVTETKTVVVTNELDI